MFQSVDALQKTLATTVFAYATDQKKASGRALGTLVEIITYYTLRSWNLRDHIVIERPLPEFANTDIRHNVEFSLHPVAWKDVICLDIKPPWTASKVRRACTHMARFAADLPSTANELLSTGQLVRNSCVILEDQVGPVVCNVDFAETGDRTVTLCHLYSHPFAMFECKRVGVEEGMRKGPQTIEKAKQGAYVARAVSALQRVRRNDGSVLGIIERPDGALVTGEYTALLNDIINGEDAELLKGLILSVGVVSNHGNWFTSDNHSKELKVLAHSYDWLLFLTDAGLEQFVRKLLLEPTEELRPAKEAFLASYTGKKGGNRFTKVRVDVGADRALRHYFAEHATEVEGWFNVIAPKGAVITELRRTIQILCNKKWEDILK